TGIVSLLENIAEDFDVFVTFLRFDMLGEDLVDHVRLLFRLVRSWLTPNVALVHDIVNHGHRRTAVALLQPKTAMRCERTNSRRSQRFKPISALFFSA